MDPMPHVQVSWAVVKPVTIICRGEIAMLPVIYVPAQRGPEPPLNIAVDMERVKLPVHHKHALMQNVNAKKVGRETNVIYKVMMPICKNMMITHHFCKLILIKGLITYTFGIFF